MQLRTVLHAVWSGNVPVRRDEANATAECCRRLPTGIHDQPVAVGQAAGGSAQVLLMRALLLFALSLPAGVAQAVPTPIAMVDPMIGTAGEGHMFPGATAPFGMVQLSPDTDTGCEIRACYGHAAGYRYEDPTIQGISHTHFSGAGHSDLGDILVVPQSGADVALDPGMRSGRERGIGRASTTRARWRIPAIMP
jgi:hypothetical protein